MVSFAYRADQLFTVGGDSCRRLREKLPPIGDGSRLLQTSLFEDRRKNSWEKTGEQGGVLGNVEIRFFELAIVQ
jgi:hypothetical protein